MDKKSIIRACSALTLPMVVFTACTEDEPKNNGSEEDVAGAKFAIATTVKGSNATSYVLLTADNLDEGSISPIKNGLTNDGATQWVFNGTEHMVGLTYNQGSAGTTRSFYLGHDGQMHARSSEYQVSRFSSYGMYNNYILSMSTGNGPAAFADENNNLPQTLLLTYIDVQSETSRSNDTSTGAYSMENLLGNGEYVTLSGAEQSGSRIFCGAIPMGLSAYGSNVGGGKYILPGNEDLVASADGGTGGSSYVKGALSGTQYPDSCWVAIYDNESMTHPHIAKTGKISYAAGRFRSQYYQTVWAAENGDVYVFSSSFAKTQKDKRQKTTLPAGVCRIPAGTTDFDDYYCNIEALSGGRSFMRCWPAGGNYFIMAMYDSPEIKSTTSATSLAIFDAAKKTLTEVTGLPAEVSSLGKTVFVNKGKVYIPINVTDASPAIYGIDPATGVANKGLVVEGAAEINGFGYMTPIDVVED